MSAIQQVARGAAVVSAIMLVSGYLWYRSSEGSVPPVNDTVPDEQAETTPSTPISKVQIMPGSKSAQIMPGSKYMVIPMPSTSGTEPKSPDQKAPEKKIILMPGSKSMPLSIDLLKPPVPPTTQAPPPPAKPNPETGTPTVPAPRGTSPQASTPANPPRS